MNGTGACVWVRLWRSPPCLCAGGLCHPTWPAGEAGSCPPQLPGMCTPCRSTGARWALPHLLSTSRGKLWLLPASTHRGPWNSGLCTHGPGDLPVGFSMLHSPLHCALHFATFCIPSAAMNSPRSYCKAHPRKLPNQLSLSWALTIRVGDSVFNQLKSPPAADPASVTWEPPPEITTHPQAVVTPNFVHTPGAKIPRTHCPPRSSVLPSTLVSSLPSWGS